MAKKLPVLLLALCVAAPAWALDTQGNYFVRGMGNQLCASYLKAREARHAGAFADWLAGYITAFDRWTADVWRIENGNFELSLIWMEDYCRDHPAETFDVAASNMIAFLYPNRVKSASGAPPGAIAGSTMR